MNTIIHIALVPKEVTATHADFVDLKVKQVLKASLLDVITCCIIVASSLGGITCFAMLNVSRYNNC